MVRPEESSQRPRGRRRDSRFDDPAGASPVQAGAGRPGSRPQSQPWTQLELFEVREGEQVRGRQHEVKPAASTQKQWVQPRPDPYGQSAPEWPLLRCSPRDGIRIAVSVLALWTHSELLTPRGINDAAICSEISMRTGPHHLSLIEDCLAIAAMEYG